MAIAEPAARPAGAEQTRARRPDETGVVVLADGGRVAWEGYGAGEPPVVFVPPWQIVHSRVWKHQIPDVARRHRVIAWDNRGNGRSDRPGDPEVHTTRARAANLGAVMDATGVEAAVLVGLSSASGPMIVFAADHPERVLGLVLVCPSWPFGGRPAGRDVPFDEPLPDDAGWSKENVHYWARDFAGYLDFFFGEAFPEPHSTKQRDDGVGWGLEATATALAATVRSPRTVTPDEFAAMAATIRAPALVIQGTDDRIADVTQGTGLAAAIPGARLELIEGGGHIVNARDPIRVNLLLRDFLTALPRSSGGRRAGS